MTTMLGYLIMYRKKLAKNVVITFDAGKIIALVIHFKENKFQFFLKKHFYIIEKSVIINVVCCF